MGVLFSSPHKPAEGDAKENSQPTLHGDPSWDGSKVIDQQIGVTMMSRWPVMVVREDRKQLDDLAARLAAHSWPQFQCQTEEEFEDWTDEVAAFIKRRVRDVDPAMLRECIFEALPPAQQSAVRDVGGVEEIEEYLDAVAVELYPASPYLIKTWSKLTEYSMDELQEIVHVVIERVQRYARVAERRSENGQNKMGHITAFMIGEAIKPLLPTWAKPRLDLSKDADLTLIQQLKKLHTNLKGQLSSSKVDEVTCDEYREVDELRCSGCLRDNG